MLLNKSFVQGLPEDIGRGMRSGQRGGQREEHPATSFLKKKLYDCSPQFGPVEST